MNEFRAVETESIVPSKYSSKDNIPSKYNNNYDNNSKAERSNFTKTVYMLAVNEIGIRPPFKEVRSENYNYPSKGGCKIKEYCICAHHE